MLFPYKYEYHEDFSTEIEEMYYHITVNVNYKPERYYRNPKFTDNIGKTISEDYVINNVRIESGNLKLKLLPHKFDISKIDEDHVVIDLLCGCSFTKQITPRISSIIIFLLNKYIKKILSFSSEVTTIDGNRIYIKKYSITNFM